MSLSDELIKRSSSCELCESKESLIAYLVPPKNVDLLDNKVVVCSMCYDQITTKVEMDVNHWRCLGTSMWNEHLPVQVLSYRLLSRLSKNDWARNFLEMMYLEESDVEWALWVEDAKVIHKDINGIILKAGDSVTLVKDLNVKGGGFTAKQGVSVRRIRLDPNNENYIEGKVAGQDIVILTKYVKKNT